MTEAAAAAPSDATADVSNVTDLMATLQGFPLAKVRELLHKAEGDLQHAKDRKAMFDAELVRRFKPDFDGEYSRLNKLSGAVTMQAENFKLSGEIDKDVKWDSHKLMTLAGSMPWAQVTALFRIEFGVTEANFNAMKAANPGIYDKLVEARTVKYSPLKVKFKAEPL